MPNATEAKPFLSVAETAERLHIARTTAYALLRTGEFPVPPVKVGRVIKFRTTDVARFIEGDQ